MSPNTIGRLYSVKSEVVTIKKEEYPCRPADTDTQWKSGGFRSKMSVQGEGEGRFDA